MIYIKLLAALIMTAFTVPAHSVASSIDVSAEAVDHKTNKPIPGVAISFVLIRDEKYRHHGECKTATNGRCKTSIGFERSFFGSNQLELRVTGQKEHYETVGTKWLGFSSALLSLKSERIELESAQRDALAKKEREEFALRLMQAEERAVYICTSESRCNAAFALAEIFISEAASTQIRLATGNLIETHQSANPDLFSAKAIKLPGDAGSARIIVSATCLPKTDENLDVSKCLQSKLGFLEMFEKFMKTRTGNDK